MTEWLWLILWVVSGFVAGVVFVRSNPESSLNFHRDGRPKPASPSEQGLTVLGFTVCSPLVWAVFVIFGICWLLGQVATYRRG